MVWDLFCRKIEAAANIATIVVAILLSVVLVKAFLLPASPPSHQALSARATNFIQVGTSLKDRLAGITWNRNGQTLLFVLSTQCHYCTESAPFFRQIRERAGKDVKLVGVLPQPVAEAEAYLNGEGVRLDEVKQVSLDKVGVTGTPTLLLVNSNGIVTQTWVGKLAPDKQDQVLKVLARST